MEIYPMYEKIAGIALVVLGSGIIFFRKPIAEYYVSYQIWFFRIPLGKNTTAIGRKLVDFGYLFVPIIGLIFVVAGILSILGILK